MIYSISNGERDACIWFVTGLRMVWLHVLWLTHIHLTTHVIDFIKLLICDTFMFCPCTAYTGHGIADSPDQLHEDVIKWKHFPRYWPFVGGIHRSPVNSPHKGQWRWALMCSLICALNKRLSKQSWGWLFETPSLLLWRHCNVSWVAGNHEIQKATS